MGFAVALIGRDTPPLAGVALFVSFLVLWVLSGVVLRRDWRIEHQAVSRESRA